MHHCSVCKLQIYLRHKAYLADHPINTESTLNVYMHMVVNQIQSLLLKHIII